MGERAGALTCLARRVELIPQNRLNSSSFWQGGGVFISSKTLILRCELRRAVV